MKSPEFDIGGMHGYRQLASADRHSVASVAGSAGERFTVNAGDRWQPGGESSDDEKLSERAEFRSLTEDVVGDGRTYCYSYGLLIPADYPEISPKQTLGQWHEGGYPVAFVRYENGKLEFVTNFKSSLNYRVEIPFTKGKPVALEFLFRWDPGEERGGFYVEADGVMVAAEKRHSLVEPSSKTVYFKYGIYRSGMGAYVGPKPAPAQTVFYSGVRRSIITAGAVVPARAAVTAPAPSISQPVAQSAVPVVSDIYKRIVDELWALDQLKLEIVKTHPASGDWCDQAKAKLGKAIDQMKKTDLKTAVRA